MTRKEPKLDRVGMICFCSECGPIQVITREGEEEEIRARHKRETGHEGFHYIFTNSARAESHERSAWLSLVRSKKWRGRKRLPAFYATCSGCHVERPCVLWENKPICYNCALLQKIGIRRGFVDREHLRVPRADNGEVPAWEGGDLVDDMDLPPGMYYFDYTEAANLDSIRKNGLSSSTTFTRFTVQLESHPYPGETRLFLYPLSQHCFYNMRTETTSSFEPVPTVTLRFRRKVLRAKVKIWDDGYGGGVFSCFVRDVVVPPSEIEVCSSTRWDEFRKMEVSSGWTKLMFDSVTVPS